MKKSPIDLAADNSSDEKHVKTVLHGLRHMARLGQVAARALASIEEKGYYAGKVPTIARGVHLYSGREEHVLRTYDLRKRAPTPRELAPPLSDIDVIFGKLKEGQHGGTQYEFCNIWLQGTFLVQSIDGKHALERQKACLGELRLKRSGTYSFRADFSYPMAPSNVVPIYANFASEKARESARCLAAAAASWIVDRTRGDSFELSQFMNDMRQNVQRWLIDEGHVQRWCVAMREGAKVLEVMDG